MLVDHFEVLTMNYHNFPSIPIINEGNIQNENE